MITKNNTHKIYNLISNMNISFGNQKGLAVDQDLKLTPKGKERLINQLLNLYDENRELRDDAFIPKIRKEIFDAICDLDVFLYGASHFINKPLSDFTVSFGEEIVLPDGKKFPISQKKEAQLYVEENSFEMIKVMIDTLIEKIHEEDLDAYQVEAENLAKALFVLFELFKKDDKKHTMLLLNQIVNDSNLSKLCRNMDEVEATLQFYRERGIQVDFKESELLQNNGEPFLIVYSAIHQVIQDRKNGVLLFDKNNQPIMKEYPKDKFLKNLNWFEPDLSNF